PGIRLRLWWGRRASRAGKRWKRTTAICRGDLSSRGGPEGAGPEGGARGGCRGGGTGGGGGRGAVPGRRGQRAPAGRKRRRYSAGAVPSALRKARRMASGVP